MDVRLNKKIVLLIIKYGTWLISAAYVLQLILSMFGIQSILLSLLFSVSFIPALLLITFSLFLGFCIWNRLPMYYILTINLLNAFDFYIGIPVTGKWILTIYLLIAGIFILIGCIIKNKKHVKERNFKERSVSNSG